MDSPEETDLLRAVGAGLSNWSIVELQLSKLFAILSGMDQEKAHLVFDGIISFEIRLGICDRLMATEDVDEIEAEMWGRLSAKLTKFYKKRHELAHFSLSSLDGKSSIMPFLTYEKMFSATATRLDAKQIRERSRKFIELHLAVLWFYQWASIRRLQELGSARPVPVEPSLVPQLRALAIQILEARTRQPPDTLD